MIELTIKDLNNFNYATVAESAFCASFRDEESGYVPTIAEIKALYQGKSDKVSQVWVAECDKLERMKGVVK